MSTETSTALRVVATIPVRPDAVETARSVLATLTAATREEEGCLEYDAFESQAAPGTFVTVESWRDQADLDAHMQTPHIQAALAAIGDSLAGEIAIHPLRPV